MWIKYKYINSTSSIFQLEKNQGLVYIAQVTNKRPTETENQVEHRQLHGCLLSPAL